MTALLAREILSASRQDAWKLPYQEVTVRYDDGESRVLRKQQVIFNRYCWDLLWMYPGTPITVACDITTYLKSNGFDGDTHKLLLEGIFKHICKFQKLETYSQKAPLLKMVYKIIDNIQNEILMQASAWVSTIDAMDFVKVVNDPAVMKIHANLRSTPEGMDRAYRDIREYVNTTTEKNRFVDAYRSKAVNDNQANQCIGPRGFVTDLSRTVYTQPITSGFIRGMSTLYEMMTESCTAAKSLNANGTHIQTSEYTSRRFQILTMVVRSIVNGDCGSTEYLDIIVTPLNIDNLRGKYYLQEDGSLGCIEGDETHLYDKLIQLRSGLHCKHVESDKICTTCLGKLSQNFKENSNLGYTMSAFLMEKVSQAILGTKHLTQSVRKSLIQLEGLANKYFRPDENGNLYFHKDVDLTGMQLILPNASVGRLVDVLNLQHTNIGLAKIGELDSVIIRDMKPKTPIADKLSIAYKDRNCIITQSLLKHIKASNMESDHRGNFVIPLDTFDRTQPVFNNPLKETDILAFVSRISSIVETNKDKITDPDEKLALLVSTVADRFKCNLSVLEVLVYATTTYNAGNNDYRLGRNTATPATAGKTELFRYRDFAGLAVFEKQPGEIIDQPAIAFNRKVQRQEHPMNVFLVPQSVVGRH